jgi:hypothetical protein
MEQEIAVGMSIIRTHTEHLGQALIQLVDKLDLSDWEELRIDAPVEWVKTLHREGDSRLHPYWNGSR